MYYHTILQVKYMIKIEEYMNSIFAATVIP